MNAFPGSPLLHFVFVMYSCFNLNIDSANRASYMHKLEYLVVDKVSEEQQQNIKVIFIAPMQTDEYWANIICC